MTLPETPRARSPPRRAAAIARAVVVAGMACGALTFAVLVAGSRSAWMADIAASFRPPAALGLLGALLVLRAWIPAALVVACAVFLGAP